VTPRRTAERQRYAAVAVAHGAALGDRVVAVGGREDVGHAPARPERRCVVAGHPGVGTPHAVAVPAGVHERRIAPAQRVGIEAEANERVGPDAREEHVRRLEELVQHPPAALGPQVEGDRPLAPVGQRDRHVHPAAVGADPLGDESSVRVALVAVHPHDVGPPVGEQGAGDRDEHPLGELDDADAVEGAITHRIDVILAEQAAVGLEVAGFAHRHHLSEDLRRRGVGVEPQVQHLDAVDEASGGMPVAPISWARAARRNR
jgi:hypothetical protein